MNDDTVTSSAIFILTLCAGAVGFVLGFWLS